MAEITTAEFAAELGTDTRTARKFLRSVTPKEEQPGKGSRWVLDGRKASLNKMRKQFNEWNSAQAEAKVARAEKAAEKAAEDVMELEDDIDLDD